LSNEQNVSIQIENTRRRVSFGARSGKPAAVVQPATGTNSN
jgi:hypothetical protein